MLLSSHILAEVEKLCDRVTIIRAGRTVRERHARRAAAPDPHHGDRVTERGPAPGWPTCPACTTCATEGGRVTFSVDAADLDAAVRALGGLGVRSLVAAPPSLEDLFLRHYGEELAEAGVR